MRCFNDIWGFLTSKERKKCFLCVLCALLRLIVFPLGAAESQDARPTFHPSLKVASEAAAANQSLVLLVFSAEWCDTCKALKKNTLDSKEFRESGGPLRVTDVDIDANEKMAHSFSVSAVPTLVLLSADGKIVSRATGYMETTNLLGWVEEGRRRAKAGQWEGAAPKSQLDILAAKAAGDGLDTNDLAHLIAQFGDPDPTDRAAAAKLLLAQREQAVPPLIEALVDPYLGVRIGASEVLQRLAPDATAPDPWLPAADMSNNVATLRKWWSDTGKLSTAPARRTPDPTMQGSIRQAIEDLRGDDAVRRTEAMSTLAADGAEALPSVREAIKHYERTDPHAVTLLEDVRWAILVPDSLEHRGGGVRAALARGTSGERQAATARLGHAGHEAFDALAELANDPDALVVESAVRSLSTIGGKDVIPAMAALLKASDSNLRMTAAQALGRTKSADATRHLLTVLDDPNEIVACAALAALDEVNSKEAAFNSSPGSKEAISVAVLDGLRKAMADPRWRVRAAAVEVAGKLKATDLVPEVKKLIDDPDGFVVKSALVALNGLSAAPETEQLLAVARRLPALQADAVAMIARSASEDAVKGVTQLYEQGNTAARVAILNALGHRDRFESHSLDDTWKPLLSSALSSPEKSLRRAAVDLLGKASPALAGELASPLLADEDPEARDIAAEVVLGILAGRKAGALRGSSHMLLEMGDEELVYINGVRSTTAKANAPAATPERIAAWHSNLLVHAEAGASPSVAAAIYATGDGKADLPRLAAALERADLKAIKQLAASPAMTVLMPKLPWPEGKPILERLASSPVLFVLAATASEHGKSEAADFLLEPARFKAAIEPASGEDLPMMLQRLLLDSSSRNQRTWSLLAPGERARGIVKALLDSTNAAWRAAGVYALGHREAEANRNVFEKALQDSNPWVRRAGVQGLARAVTDRPVLENLIGPFVGDTNSHVAEAAALALLEPELRAAAGLQWYLSFFQIEEVRTSSSYSFSINEDRPLAALDNKPAYLEQARRRLSSTNESETVTFALLLAQHGEFDGLDRLLAQSPAREDDSRGSAPDALLAGIALSRDAKYLPFLRRVMEKTQQDYELRKILRALKGMTGPDARQLRVEVNKRMRSASGIRASFE